MMVADGNAVVVSHNVLFKENSLGGSQCATQRPGRVPSNDVNFVLRYLSHSLAGGGRVLNLL